MSHKFTPAYSSPSPIVAIALTALAFLVAYNAPLVIFYEVCMGYYLVTFLLIFMSRLWVRHRKKKPQDIIDAILATVQYLTLLSIFWLPMFFSVEDHLQGLVYGRKSYGMLDNSIIENATALLLLFLIGGLSLFLVNALRSLRKATHRDPFDDPDLTIEDMGWMLQQSTYAMDSRMRGMRRLAQMGVEGAPYILRADLEADEAVEQLLEELLRASSTPEELTRSKEILTNTLGWMSETKLSILMRVWKRSYIQAEFLPVLAAQHKLFMDKSWSSDLLDVAIAHDQPGVHMAAVTQVLQRTGEHKPALDYLARHGTLEALPGLKEGVDKFSFTPGMKARIKEVLDVIQRRYGVEFGGLTIAEHEPEKQGALSEVAEQAAGRGTKT